MCMKIYDHWAKAGQGALSTSGQKYWLVGWAGSNLSVEDAQKEANNRISAMKEGLTATGVLNNSYSYDNDNPLKEMVIARLGDTDKPFAAITRNRYGALVLNATRVFIADVDLPESITPPFETVTSNLGNKFKKAGKKIGFFKKLFGGNIEHDEVKKHEEKGDEHHNQPTGKSSNIAIQQGTLIAQQRENTLSEIAKFHRDFPALSFLVYATAAGYRVVVTNQLVEPDSADSELWMEALNADNLYRKLCKRQQCYRARLTPKPWRLPGYRSAVFFPNGQHAQKHKLEKWLNTYEKKSEAFSVCELVATYGDGVVVDEVAQVIRVHDEHALNQSAKPLA